MFISGEDSLNIIPHYRATPTMRLLDNLKASGSAGSAMRSHSCAISAVNTERLGSFLKVDLEPRVAASLFSWAGKINKISLRSSEKSQATQKASPKETKTTVSFFQQLGSKEHDKLRRTQRATADSRQHVNLQSNGKEIT